MLAEFLRHEVENTCKWVVIYVPNILSQDFNGFTGPSIAQGASAVLVLSGSTLWKTSDREGVNSHMNLVHLKMPYSTGLCVKEVVIF